MGFNRGLFRSCVEDVIESEDINAHGENCSIIVIPATSADRRTSLEFLHSVQFQKGWMTMVRVGLLVRLQAKPGKEADVARFLENGLALANQEATTPVWFALKLGPATFGIFDAFADDAGRKAHLAGQIAAALMAKAPELLAEAPKIEQVDVLAAKISH